MWRLYIRHVEAVYGYGYGYAMCRLYIRHVETVYEYRYGYVVWGLWDRPPDIYGNGKEPSVMCMSHCCMFMHEYHTIHDYSYVHVCVTTYMVAC